MIGSRGGDLFTMPIVRSLFAGFRRLVERKNEMPNGRVKRRVMDMWDHKAV